MALKQLKNTKFYELALKEFTLWDIEKTSNDIGGNQEKIEKLNQYEELLESDKNQNTKFLYDSVNSYQISVIYISRMEKNQTRFLLIIMIS